MRVAATEPIPAALSVCLPPRHARSLLSGRAHCHSGDSRNPESFVGFLTELIKDSVVMSNPAFLGGFGGLLWFRLRCGCAGDALPAPMPGMERSKRASCASFLSAAICASMAAQRPAISAFRYASMRPPSVGDMRASAGLQPPLARVHALGKLGDGRGVGKLQRPHTP